MGGFFFFIIERVLSRIELSKEWMIDEYFWGYVRVCRSRWVFIRG